MLTVLQIENTMVEESKSGSANNDSIFNQCWADKLIEEDVFEGDPS